MSELQIDASQLFEPRMPPNMAAPSYPEHATAFLALADQDYVMFRVLGLVDQQGPSLHQLNGAVEKYLKALILTTDVAIPRGPKGHDLVHLWTLALPQSPALNSNGLRNFCWCLNPYSQLGRYPEPILGGELKRRAGWNRASIPGIRQADLVVAHLREQAIIASGSGPDTAWLLESLVHDELPFSSAWLAELPSSLSAALLYENDVFDKTTLPSFPQRYQERLVFPMRALPLTAS